MRIYVGDRIDDGTTAVFAIDEPPRPSIEEVREVLGELLRLNDGPAAAARDAAFHARKEDLLARIDASGRVGQVIPLHPPSADRRFEWGKDSPACFDLARAILTDSVGDPPPHPVVDRYVAEVVAFLPKDRFRLDARNINEWLIGQGLFVEAELAAHRGGLGPERPALRIVAPEEHPAERGAGDASADPATASALVAACEQAWAEIQRHHPDVPHAVVVLGSGVERGRLVKLGHWWGGRWVADNEVRGEVLLAGEALHLPAEQVFEVLLHEATHGINAARDVKDTSRGGRYHNRRFRMTAELVGLDVAAMPPYGWARTTLTAETAERYSESIDKLRDAMRIARRVDPRRLGAPEAETGGDGGTAGTEGSGSQRETERRRGGLAICGCGRRMRMAPSVLAAGPVMCGLCGHEFQAGRAPSRSREHESSPGVKRDGVVDESFLPRRRDVLAAEGAAPPAHPAARLGAFLAAAREAGYAAHPAVMALSHHHSLLVGLRSPGDPDPPLPPLTATQREGLVELVMAGDKPGDWAVASWYRALGTEQERPMAAGTLSEAGRRRNLARAMLKADGTLHGPAVEVRGREFLAGEQIVVGPRGIHSLDLDAGVPGSVTAVDPDGGWLDVDFPTAGHHRFPTTGPEAAALTYGYSEVVPGVERLDLRTLDLRPPAAVETVPAVPLPEIDL